MRTTPLVHVVFLFAAACGDNIVPGVSIVPEVDAPIPEPPPEPRPVTLTITMNGAGVPDVAVFFQNADSSLVSATTTDANGAASAIMDPSGYVTAINALPPSGENVYRSDIIETFAGVKPGDHLMLNRTDLMLVTFDIVLPLDPSEGVAWYRIATSCGARVVTPIYAAVADSFGTPISLGGCNGVADIMIVSEDSSYAALNYFYVPDVAVADAATVDLSGHSYAPVSSRDYTYRSVPDQMSLELHDTSVSSRGPIYHATSDATGTGTMTATANVPTFEGATQVIRTDTEWMLPTSSTQSLIDWGSYGIPFSTNVGDRLLREFSELSFDASKQAISWTESATGATPDLCVATIHTGRQSESRSWVWRVTAPYGAAVTLPTLPITDYHFTPADSVRLSMLMARVPGGYDAARPFLLSWPIERLVAGPTGSLEYTMFSSKTPE